MVSLLAWHQPVLSQLAVRRESERLSHASLLSVGSDQEAMAFATALPYYLLCESYNACGSCRACRLLAQGAHSDHHLCQPEGTSKVIKIDQIRALLAMGAKTASYPAGKVLVVAPASSLNRNAANALLKFLEEPPTQTYLFLVASKTSQLPATVRSRCQRVPLARPSLDQSLEYLREHGLSQTCALEALNLANGEPLLALDIEQSGSASALLNLIDRVQAVLQGGASAREIGIKAQNLEATLVLSVLIASAYRNAVDQAERSVLDTRLLTWHKALVDLSETYARSPNINIPLALEQLCVNIR